MTDGNPFGTRRFVNYLLTGENIIHVYQAAMATLFQKLAAVQTYI